MGLISAEIYRETFQVEEKVLGLFIDGRFEWSVLWEREDKDRKKV